MIAKEEFLEKYNITEESFRAAEISWDELCIIYQDFDQNKINKYENILTKFTNNYLKDIHKISVHTVRSRVKDAEHLLEKIVRKKQENAMKYQQLDTTNYEKFITDLIGIRCLILFKEDWKEFHRYITSVFENDVRYYIKDCIRDFDDNIKHNYIAEEPKVHIRNGDSREIYEGILSPGHIIDGRNYRSVHYIIKYEGVYLEIQVRTLFEEGWGEIDHAIVYPYYKNDPILKEYTELLNRLCGLADEMGGFFHRLKQIEVERIPHQSDVKKDKNENVRNKDKPVGQDDIYKKTGSRKVMETFNDCLETVQEE
ncbi:MAG: GTP pyrophosphokinase [Eubacterium sp.]|nr:GTP pyrophosphokinase [Eubacterium sp.]